MVSYHCIPKWVYYCLREYTYQTNIKISYRRNRLSYTGGGNVKQCILENILKIKLDHIFRFFFFIKIHAICFSLITWIKVDVFLCLYCFNHTLISYASTRYNLYINGYQFHSIICAKDLCMVMFILKKKLNKNDIIWIMHFIKNQNN